MLVSQCSLRDVESLSAFGWVKVFLKVCDDTILTSKGNNIGNSVKNKCYNNHLHNANFIFM